MDKQFHQTLYSGWYYLSMLASKSIDISERGSCCLYAPHKGTIINMMTTSNGNILCATGPVLGEFFSQRPVRRSFDVFFDLCLNKWLSKQSLGWWFEMPSCSLWRHCNGQISDVLPSSCTLPPLLSACQLLLLKASSQSTGQAGQSHITDCMSFIKLSMC